MDELTIRPFRPSDQTRARRIIIEGLGGHFGFIDETLNPDLDDIAGSYGTALFLVAEAGGEIVGTGALVRREDGCGQIVRMSTDEAWRRQGVAAAVLKQLLDGARDRGLRRVVVQTQPEWEDAVGLYTSTGFRRAGVDDVDVVLHLDL